MIDIQKKVDEYMLSTRRKYPVNRIHASALGHPCIRNLVYRQTHWKEAKEMSLQGLYTVDEGRRQEKKARELMQEAEIEIVRVDEPFVWKGISGKIDGMIKLAHNQYIPIEIKSVQPHEWDRFEDADQFYTSGKWWYRAYLAQLTLYLLMSEIEQGMFILTSYRKPLKQLPYQLVYEFGESLLKKAELIQKHIREGTEPDRIEYDEQVCGMCDFQHICLPDKIRDESLIVIDDELEALLEERTLLQEQTKRYREIEKAIKKKIGEREHLVVNGRWEIIGKKTIRKAYTVEEAEVIRYQYRRLGGENGEGERD